ncbi:MAG: hypothetical protein KatS3mg105_2861 [Gemmatales bacterium]|nr:MAG: hypothetical protein KatS3mg105_2861 [Gemmatales bacterium]
MAFQMFVVVSCALCGVADCQGVTFRSYLLEGANGVFVLNLKKLFADRAGTKQLQKTFADFVPSPLSAAIKHRSETFDVVRDIDRLTVVKANSLCPRKGKYHNKPLPCTFYAIIEGEIDSQKIRAYLEWLSRKAPIKATSQRVRSISLWEVKTGDKVCYVAVPQRGTMIISGARQHIVDTLSKSGSKKPGHLGGTIAELLKRVNCRGVAGWVASSDMIIGTFYKGTQSITVEHITLAANGIKSVVGSVTGRDRLDVEMSIACKNAHVAEKIGDELVSFAKRGANVLRERGKDFEPLRESLKTVTVTSKNDVVRLQWTLTAGAISGLLKTLYDDSL